MFQQLTLIRDTISSQRAALKHVFMNRSINTSYPLPLRTCHGYYFRFTAFFHMSCIDCSPSGTLLVRRHEKGGERRRKWFIRCQWGRIKGLGSEVSEWDCVPKTKDFDVYSLTVWESLCSQWLSTWSLFCLPLDCRRFQEIRPSMSEASWSGGHLQEDTQLWCVIWLGQQSYVAVCWFPTMSMLCSVSEDSSWALLDVIMLFVFFTVTWPIRCPQLCRGGVLSFTNCFCCYWI